MSATRIIIDTDPGQDDALAILLALAERERLDVLGITTVAGNVPVELTTANALRVDRRGRTPRRGRLSRGEPAARAGRLDHRGIHLRSRWARGRRAAAACGVNARDAHAVDFIVDTLTAAAGALDYVVRARAADQPRTRIRAGGRRSPARCRRDRADGRRSAILATSRPPAEFNFYVDPHAAHAVLTLGVPITMFSLHAAHQAMATRERVASITALGTPVARCVTGMLLRHRPGAEEKFGVQARPMHDPCVIAFALWPEIFTTREVRRRGDRECVDDRPQRDRLVGCAEATRQRTGDRPHRRRCAVRPNERFARQSAIRKKR